MEFRLLDPSVDNTRPTKGINSTPCLLGIGKVCIPTRTDGKKKNLILTKCLHVPGLFINVISQGQFQRAFVLLQIIQNGIEIGKRGITDWLQDNNLYYLRMWKLPYALLSMDRAPKMLIPVRKMSFFPFKGVAKVPTKVALLHAP